MFLRLRNIRSRHAIIWLCCVIFFATPAHPDNTFTPITLTDDPAALTWLRDVSGDGSTAIGETAAGAFRWRADSGIELFSTNPTVTVHGVSANGDVLVGGYVPDGLGTAVKPFRWNPADGLQELLGPPVLPENDGREGTAFGVSADGSVIVGEFGEPPGYDPVDCDFNCTTIVNGSMHAFRWTQSDGLQAVVNAAIAPGSSAVETSADGSVIAINTFDYLAVGCFRGATAPCRPRRVTGAPVLAKSLDLTFNLANLQSGDFLTTLSSDGSTLAGLSDDDVPFRWREPSFYQQLVRRGLQGQRIEQSTARASNKSGDLVGGDFGLWQYGRSVSLKNLLLNGLGLNVAGWDFTGPLNLYVFPPGRRYNLFGSSGITGISDDGLTWVGTANNPDSIPQGFVVTLDEPAGPALWNSLPALQENALLSAVLPNARTVTVGNTVTVFASIINNSTTPLEGCSVTRRTRAPIKVDYWRFDPASNEILGEPSQPFSIAPGGTEVVLLALTAQGEFDDGLLRLRYDCGNTLPDDDQSFLDSIALLASSQPEPDIVSLAATASASGYALLDSNGNGAFAVATTNLGAANSDLRASVISTSSDITPLICETEPDTGLCKSPPTGSELTIGYDEGRQRTFAVFLNSSQRVQADPEFTRVLFIVTPAEPSSPLYGLTSVAVADAALLPPEPAAVPTDARTDTRTGAKSATRIDAGDEHVGR